MELSVTICTINLLLRTWYLHSQSCCSSSVELPVHYHFPYSEPVQSGPHNHALFISVSINTRSHLCSGSPTVLSSSLHVKHIVIRSYYLSTIRRWTKLISRQVERCFPSPQTLQAEDGTHAASYTTSATLRFLKCNAVTTLQCCHILPLPAF
jgi:hypothetical protein